MIYCSILQFGWDLVGQLTSVPFDISWATSGIRFTSTTAHSQIVGYELGTISLELQFLCTELDKCVCFLGFLRTWQLNPRRKWNLSVLLRPLKGWT